MRTFLNDPLLDINRTYQMCAQHSFVLLYHWLLNVHILKKMRTLNITVQVLDKIYMLKLSNSIISNGFWYIEHYGACFEDDFDAVMN